METKKLSRRDWIRTGALTAGGMTLLPYLGISETPKAPLLLNELGNVEYSPFFQEFVLEEYPKPDALLAKLNANENPYGPSPMAVDALKKVATKGNRYAWRELFDLIDKIAAHEGVKAENIIMGPGSSDILEKTGMVFFKGGGNVVSADPSYMSLMRVAEATGGTWKPVPLKDDWSHDLDAMEAAVNEYTNLVYICNPNNPTGTLTDPTKLLDFCSRVSEKVPVFVDEAYLGFLGDGTKQSMVSLVNEGKDVIVARTFSKIHGMAGLRVGYGVAQPETIARIQEITRGGMGISYTSIFAAMASMDDVAFQDKSRTLNAAARDYVFTSLKDMGLEPVPSYTSFMIFPIEMEGKDFLEKMTALKVGVRAFQFLGKKWCRVSMGTMDEMKIFVSALQKVLV
ncbi:histidinol-phosphate aminotransferase [Saonia flava]|uniref:Histidinol-phosphate aminotransferase n=1 Tax=Saonia flava TaxID=523696 RepID=A0A846R4E8_9FLAO|nr:histidinol-phosphate transaminase [Saonia flava]NJB71679.1 histidinol-phosphate aminotransferase [Saonia flava]